jgi:CIC family chloride channel protein
MNQVAPFPTGDSGAYALVGMGTLFAGIIRAPMTSVFMIFEITQDYQIIVPLMVANLLSFVISRRYQPVPIYHALLRQDGVHLPERIMTTEPSRRSPDLPDDPPLG